MKKIFTILFILTYCSQVGFSQQLPLFTQYRENAGLINPASISTSYLVNENNLSFGASYRRQWVGFANAPQTETIRGEYFYDKSGGFGLLSGGYIVNDQTGPTGFTGAYGRIAGVITDDPTYWGISVGLNLGVVQYRVDVSELRLREQNDILTMDDQSKIFPDAGVGVYYHQTLQGGFLDDDKFYAGLSIPQVIGLNLNFKDDTGDFNIKRVQHFYGLLGLIKHFNDSNFIETSMWLKYAPNSPFNADFNIRYQMQNRFWLGTGMSTAGTFHLEAGLISGENTLYGNKFMIGYGFDYSFNTFGPFTGSTHELNVSYSLAN